MATPTAPKPSSWVLSVLVVLCWAVSTLTTLWMVWSVVAPTRFDGDPGRIVAAMAYAVLLSVGPSALLGELLRRHPAHRRPFMWAAAWAGIGVVLVWYAAAVDAYYKREGFTADPLGSGIVFAVIALIAPVMTYAWEHLHRPGRPST